MCIHIQISEKFMCIDLHLGWYLQAYLQKMIASEKQSVFHQVVVCCICNLLDAVPHFNCCDSKVKNQKNYKKRKNVEKLSQLQENVRKKNRKELMTKTREEVAADYKAASLALDIMKNRRMQSETLSAVFVSYFRILKHPMVSTAASSEANASSTASAPGAHQLLAPCLNGLGKFSHLIDLDYISDLMNYLKKIAVGGSSNNVSSQKCLNHLAVSECLRCCIIAFKDMRNNLDAINVDLQDFLSSFTI